MFSSVSASQASEVVGLMLAVFIVPITILAVKDLRHPGRHWLTVGFFLIAGVRIFSLVERYAFGNPVFPTKQFMNAFAGVAFAVGIWQLSLSMRRGEPL